ncbi:hypothetical protein CHGG_10421 [Chaetomium globosum CBS 148.51]|uniref:Required for respiratory growth protein 9, mitochondrial n=1 Tax=Chaetomium globosum (strain ATCC 6205 / CBS 148.51 / DSM 1962 / NBRC 6347 / NRRL 1970) TaxID=306901 RepID=RRG9_CHAGB|nr:uncharacterized protein CHGG_10421 [Chaetomium globosum CBS 148.51]Q2GNN3.1 RecName: Full=Required for respiratory growth protein 9, mitochondrial; Flags: Precursor [Chaetomium globosum CBS 148.51]EAQ84017.1 hypothetical protein CHGG_10421 [Chaetomium globosum CBS 148.51]
MSISYVARIINGNSEVGILDQVREPTLKIFVRTIAQIHVPLRTTTPRATQYRALSTQPNRACTQQTSSILATTPRALHTSCARDRDWQAPKPFKRRGGGRSVQNNPLASSHASEPVANDPFRHLSQNDYARPTARPQAYRSKTGDSGGREQRYKPAGGARKPRRPNPESNTQGGNWAEPKTKEPWRIQKEALAKKFPEGWKPRKKLSPDALVGIRMLHQQFPDEYTTETLAQKFEVSPEAIRRILKAKWVADPETEVERQARWHNRGKQVWTKWAALGKKPPRKWRAEGIVRDPIWNEPRGPNHKDKAARAEAQRREAQRRLASGMMG